MRVSLALQRGGARNNSVPPEVPVRASLDNGRQIAERLHTLNHYVGAIDELLEGKRAGVRMRYRRARDMKLNHVVRNSGHLRAVTLEPPAVKGHLHCSVRALVPPAEFQMS